MKIKIVMPKSECAGRLSRVLEEAEKQLDKRFYSERKATGCEGIETEHICGLDAIRRAICKKELQNGRIIFAISFNELGINTEYYLMLEVLRKNRDALCGSICGMVIDGQSEFSTKAAARELSFTISEAGAYQIGKSLVEGTGSLYNQRITAENNKISTLEAYIYNAADLFERIAEFENPLNKHPKLLCLHASEHQTSNTVKLWNMVKSELEKSVDIKELTLRNGEISDCSGCPFRMCMHFSEKGSCYYGGIMVEDVYPAVEQCNALMLLCPNYNDSYSANISAFINRLTALYRRKPFYDKKLFAIIVSGYSGGDIIAGQLAGSLGMNKSFIIPPRFAMVETANHPNSIMEIPNIRGKAIEFAKHIQKHIEL